MNQMPMKAWIVMACLALSLALGLSQAAYAEEIQLGVGCNAALFTPEYGTCTNTDVQHIFSNFVCQYQKIVSEILSQVYCGMVDALITPLGIVLTLFVSVLGASILIGLTQFTARDLMLALFKIALVVAFATRSEFMIGILYKGLVGFITGGVDLVMKSATDQNQAGGSANALLGNIDKLINGVLSSASFESAKPADQLTNQCNSSPLPLFMTFLVSAPPLFALGVGMAFKLLFVFLRAVIGYLLALTLIMFLVSLCPVFLSLGLFQSTRSYFEKWVGYLISSALQIVVVFAFIGFVMSMGLEGDFKKLVGLSVPYNDNMWQEGQRQDNHNYCTFGEHVNFETGQSSGDPVPPGAIWKMGDVLRFVGTQMFKLLLLAMLVEKILDLAPEVARRLGGVDTAPRLGGSGGIRDGFNIELAGASSFQSMTQGVSRGFSRGGALPGRIGGAVSEGYAGAMHGENDSGGIVTEIVRNLIGLR